MKSSTSGRILVKSASSGGEMASPVSFKQKNIPILSPKSSQTNANTMLDVKQHRKRAESDLQLLANRIALLRVEEQKALNKVNETKARAEEILE